MISLRSQPRCTSTQRTEAVVNSGREISKWDIDHRQGTGTDASADDVTPTCRCQIFMTNANMTNSLGVVLP